MITDRETNILYLSPLLEVDYPSFSKEFFSKLNKYKVDLKFIPHTKDVWCRDYMPIQIRENSFARFTYDPPYLKNDKPFISDNIAISTSMELQEVYHSILKVEGGNIVKSNNKVITTSRIFKDNPEIEKDWMVESIRDFLSVDEVIIIPEQPKDFTGHSDGMVRFIDDETVMINDYQDEEDREFVEKFYKVLAEHQLKIIEIPTSMYSNKTSKDATGCYINYLQVGKIIFLPVFDRKEDKKVEDMFNTIFKIHDIVPVISNELAEEGGILNCISWNIMTPKST